MPRTPQSLAQTLQDSEDPTGNYMAGVPDLTHQMVVPLGLPGMPMGGGGIPQGETLQDIFSPMRTVSDPGPHTTWRGIWDNPKAIATEAAANTAPESPNLKTYFGTSREELADLANRELNPDQMYWVPKPKARGAATAARVMTPSNAQRLIDTMAEVKQTAPGMWEGMKGWYIMDPAYKLMVQQYGPDKAADMFKRLNSMAFFSPASNVIKEINRGTAGNMLYNQGLTDQYLKAGYTNEGMAGMGYPLVKGHMFNKMMVPKQAAFIDQGMTPEAMMAQIAGGDPKVSLYYQASLPPELGGQSQWLVPDSHFARGVGLADVRAWKAKRVPDPNNPGHYVSTDTLVPNGESIKSPEYTPLAPWYRDNIAKPLGLQAVPAQAIQWGAYARRTGVDTPVGAPKLELFADRIDQIARELGITSQKDRLKFRDKVLAGKHHAALDVLSPDAFG